MTLKFYSDFVIDLSPCLESVWLRVLVSWKIKEIRVKTLNHVVSCLFTLTLDFDIKFD